MKWKIPLSTVIDGNVYLLRIDSTVQEDKWIITVEDRTKKVLPEPIIIQFTLAKKLIGYEPITSVTCKFAPFIAQDLMKFARYW